MRTYLHLQHAILGTPWAVTPQMLSLIVEIVHDRATGGPRPSDAVIAERLEAAAARNGPRAGGRQQGQVAVLPLYGLISPRAGMAADTSGGTSLESLAGELDALVRDPAVSAIVLDVDSPGGSVEGVAEFADRVRAARAVKPVVAVANTLAASAAYWIASQADEVVASPSSQLGSIGVLAAHEDWSAADEAKGVRTTLISAGKYKAEGNRHAPLDDEARGNIQQTVDHYYAMFTQAVARGRRVPISHVRDGMGQGRMLVAPAAVEAKMADRIDTLDATVARLARGQVPEVASPEPAQALAAYAATWGTAWAVDGIVAGPIARHRTATSEDAWDGPANEARLPSSAGPLRASHAWVDAEGDPDAKSSYRFIHHYVAEDGTVGAASTRACSTGIGVLNGGRGGTTIPDGDRAGVHTHLAGHLADAGQEAPALAATPTPTTGAGTALAALDLAEARLRYGLHEED